MDPSPHRGAPSHPHHKHNDSANSSSDQNQHRVRFAEGEPQATYTIHQPTPRRERAAAAPSASSTQPAVYWDERRPDRDIDRESDANLAGYTFYREGTPTPPDYETPEKRLGHHGHGGFGGPIAESSTIGGGTIGSERDFNLGHHNDNGNWSVAGSNGKSPSARKRTLWISIAVGILLLIGIAVGVGVGVSLNMSKGRAPAVEATQTASRFVNQKLCSLPGRRLTWPQLPTSISTRPQPDAHKLTHHNSRRHGRRRRHNLINRRSAADLQLGLPCAQQHNIPRPGLNKTLPACLRHRLQQRRRHRSRRGLHGEHGRLHEQLRLL